MPDFMEVCGNHETHAHQTADRPTARGGAPNTREIKTQPRAIDGRHEASAGRHRGATT
jgi:hypothetical protein